MASVDQPRRGFGPIERRLSRCGDELTNSAKLVVLNLLGRVGKTSAAWPEQARIASETGISERSVRRALRELEREGFLVTEHRGRGMSNRYAVQVAALSAWANRPEGPVSPAKVDPQVGRPERPLWPVSTNTKKINKLKTTPRRLHTVGGDDPSLLLGALRDHGFRITGRAKVWVKDVLVHWAAEDVQEAITISHDNGHFALSYVDGVLNAWERAGRRRRWGGDDAG